MYDKKDALKVNLSQVAMALGIVLEERAGYHLASCPYHNDTHASFIVYDNLDKPIQGIWQCFTCGIQGDSIDLVMKEKKLTFSEAVNWIGETFELQRQDLTPEQKQLIALKARIAPVLIEANEWFISQRNEWYYEYLEQRGFEHQTSVDWDFGYAPNNIIDLKKHLYDKGFDDEQLVGSGLFKHKASGVEPVFYGRLMIPIKDRLGNIVGFAGRTQNEYEKAKYITTTAEFTKKKRIAYGLDRVRKADNVKRLFLVEGNLDTPKFIQNTNEYAVSMMGASITADHIKEIAKTLPDLTTIIIALDGDDAGRRAVNKFIKLVYASEDFYFKHKIDFFVFPMPDGMDMDMLVTDYRDLFPDLRRNIIHIIDYMMMELRNEYDKDNKIKNDKFTIECLKLIASVEHLRAQNLLEKLSELSGYDMDFLRKELYPLRVEYLTDSKMKYEKKVLRYLIDNKEDRLEELGVPVERIFSERGRQIMAGMFERYATKLFYMSILEEEEIDRDMAVFFGHLLFASSIYEIIVEYDSLSKDSKLRINKNTQNEINNINQMYKQAISRVTRRIDG